MEYLVKSNTDLQNLVNDVNVAMKEGWTAVGGLTCAPGKVIQGPIAPLYQPNVFLQALTRP